MRLVSRILSVLAIAAFLASPATAGPYALLRTLQNPMPAPSDYFGYPVVALGGDLLVGGAQDDTLAEDAGAVYLLEGNPTSPAFGALLHIFSKPGATDDDYFGYAVATVGTNVVIGSTGDDTAGPDAGAAYLFDGDPGSLTFGDVLQTFLNPTPTASDYFGYAVLGVGGNVAVSDFLDDAVGAAGGAVYLFDAATGALLHTFLPPEAGEHRFGYALAAIGSQLIVGAPHATPLHGAVYVYDANPASPTFGDLLRTLANPVATATEFGESVAVVGGNILVGAPFQSPSDLSLEWSGAAYLFDGATGALMKELTTPHPAGNGQFGYAVASLGTLALIGAPHENVDGTNAGGVYLFDADPLSPTFGDVVQRLGLPSTSFAGDGFGFSVAASGTTVVVGAPAGSPGGLAHAFTPCGDGIISLVEDCEDGNLAAGDCCSSSCQFDAAGAACDDGDADACTTGFCTGAGSCVAQGAVPQPGCATPITGKARLRIDGGSVDWRWRSGTPTPLASFGDPTTSTAYTLCVYDQSGGSQPVLRSSAPAGGLCNGKPCWQAQSAKGFRYKDSDRTPDGLVALTLKTGKGDRADIALKGGGANLTPAALPLTATVTAQLKASTGACWEAEYSSPQRNDATIFKAGSD